MDLMEDEEMAGDDDDDDDLLVSVGLVKNRRQTLEDEEDEDALLGLWVTSQTSLNCELVFDRHRERLYLRYDSGLPVPDLNWLRLNRGDDWMLINFRFTADELDEIVSLLDFPAAAFNLMGKIVDANRNAATLEQALLLVLHRFSIPDRQWDMVELFHRNQAWISGIQNRFVSLLLARWGHKLSFAGMLMYLRDNVDDFEYLYERNGCPGTFILVGIPSIPVLLLPDSHRYLW